MARTLQAKRDRRLLPAGRYDNQEKSFKADPHSLEMCEGLIDIISAYFNVSGRELRAPGRGNRAVARVRQIGMYTAHVVLQLPMAEVGRAFGRDRSTVTHACHLVEDLREDRDFEEIVSAVERVVKTVLARYGAVR
ncbi:MAG: helix-turn-helix domain-containing protein [Phyllobacterium sp.]